MIFWQDCSNGAKSFINRGGVSAERRILRENK
jgi:hypothetical protein